MTDGPAPGRSGDRSRLACGSHPLAGKGWSAALIFGVDARRAIWSAMAEYDDWNRKGAVLSDVTAEKEFGVTRAFIVAGIQAGKLEFREGSVWGNPYLRVLRSQLEPYIAAQLGAEQLAAKKTQTELRAVNKEIAAIRRKLMVLEARKVELEKPVKP